MNRRPNTLLDNQNRKSPNETTSIIQCPKMIIECFKLIEGQIQIGGMN